MAVAEPLAAWLWRTLFATVDHHAAPKPRVGLWARLAALAAQIRDPETKAQYLADWRSRFDARFPRHPRGLTEEDMLPDGRVADLSGLEEGAQARLRSVAAAWLERTGAHAAGIRPPRPGKWAWELGRRVTPGLIDEETAEDALARRRKAMTFRVAPAARPQGFPRSFDIGRKRGFDLGPLLTDMKCAGFERTDMGNAERWHARFGEDYLYTTAKGWLGWDGRRYRVLNQEKDTTPAEVLASVFRRCARSRTKPISCATPACPRTRRSMPSLLASWATIRAGPAAWTASSSAARNPSRCRRSCGLGPRVGGVGPHRLHRQPRQALGDGRADRVRHRPDAAQLPQRHAALRPARR
jgi:hypothetical protein